MQINKWWFAGLLILVLAGLNFYRYAGSGVLGVEQSVAVVSMPRSITLPTLNVPTQALELRAQHNRDLFAFVLPEPTKPVFVPKPTAAQPIEVGPNPSEVAQEAARVHMLNVHIKGILSSKDDLSTIVNAPFYNGVASVGTNLGQGIVVESILVDRVTIRHIEQGLQREISVE